MTNELGDNHLLVNVPAFHLTVRENGSEVRDIRVVIGRIGDETPVFSDRMTTIVFSPYWNIPETIATAETLPAFENDSDYLAANNIEIVRKHSPGEPIDPSTIDWDDGRALSELSFRQRPGPGNALGHVKFLFPNPFNVYIHDTPADSYFERPRRAFSHGCVRIEEPETLAEYLLRHQPEWTSEAIARAMHLGIERHVKLPQPVPIHIVYFTAWVDPKGGLHFRDDVYGYDARQLHGWPGPTSHTS
jgi:murein L,D-transpeptidase YcbB/YkuD